MYDGFINAAKEVFGDKVKIIIDRFHVAKLYRKGLDTLRKAEMKRLKNTLLKEEYTKLKNVMWILRKDKDQLTDEEVEMLQLLFVHSPLLELSFSTVHFFLLNGDMELNKNRKVFVQEML